MSSKTGSDKVFLFASQPPGREGTGVGRGGLPTCGLDKRTWQRSTRTQKTKEREKSQVAMAQQGTTANVPPCHKLPPKRSVQSTNKIKQVSS
jgi:hypothetical protein